MLPEVARNGQEWPVVARSGQVQLGVTWCSMVGLVVDRSGQMLTGFAKSGQE